MKNLVEAILAVPMVLWAAFKKDRENAKNKGKVKEAEKGKAQEAKKTKKPS